MNDTSKTWAALLRELIGGQRTHRPGSFGHISTRSHPHSRQYSKRYADGRQRDPVWRKANGLPVAEAGQPLSRAWEPAPSEKAKTRALVKAQRGSITGKLLNAHLLAARAAQRKQRK